MVKRPLYFGGATSEIYMGDRTEAPPTAKPPIIRKRINMEILIENAVPMAEIRKRNAVTFNMYLRPNLSPKRPTAIAPIIHPNIAELIAQPSITLSS